MFLLYCFTSGVAYAAVFHDYSGTRGYWLGLLGLVVFNCVLATRFKG